MKIIKIIPRIEVEPMGSTMTASRRLRAVTQALTENVAAQVGSTHPAVSTLMRAADELAAIALVDEPTSAKPSTAPPEGAS